jgi:prepilin-type N-terminal cleavage/methylation domain-containing protein
MKRSGAQGFTLLEVMVAVAILSISLTSMLSSQMAAMRATRYARGVSVAIFLAESKLVDIESDMRVEGWGTDDRDFDGNFSDEGWPEIRYQCLVDYIELPDYNALVQAKEAGDTEGDAGPAPFVADADDQAFGALGMVWPIVKAAVEQSIRKASCTVYWSDGKVEHDATVSTFWTDPKQLMQLPQTGETTEDDDTREDPTDPGGGDGGGGGGGGKGGEGGARPGITPTGGGSTKPGIR